MELERDRDLRVKKQQPQTIEQMFDRALELETTREFSQALEAYQRLLGENLSESQRFNVYKNLGNVYLKLSDINLAEGCYEKAAVLFPKSPILAVNRGVLEIQKGNLEVAKDHFMVALGFEPENDVAWVGLALVHRAHADNDLARACVLRAMDANPVNKTALVHYYQWCRDDDVEQSLSSLHEYLKSKPSDEEIRTLLKKYQGGAA